MAETTDVATSNETETPALLQSGMRRIPRATYRLQFNRSFTFADAARIVPYLHDLGISDCYASPYFMAAPGSPHGYDVIDHNALNPEVGSEEDYQAFVSELRRYEMGQLLDIVPNHMGIAGGNNPWWSDVLENGPSSLYADFFDIDWRPVKFELANKVLLPILGDQYGRVLDNQDLILRYEEGVFFLTVYGTQRLPIAPCPSTAILMHRLPELEQTLGATHPHFLELRSIITALDHLPLRTETGREKVLERHREKEVIKRRLAALTADSAEVRAFLEENVRLFNGTKGDPRSFDLLDALLADQAYRLAYWRVAAEEINYRRFFDINDLAAIRTDKPEVFVATHQLALRLFAEGKVTGFRIDHIDGLYDPAGYLRRLQRACLALRGGTRLEDLAALVQSHHDGGGAEPESDLTRSDLPCYVVVEKILGEREPLPGHWLSDGTTGYDFVPVVNGIFVAQGNEKALTNLYTRFTQTPVRFADLAYECKKLIMQLSLSGEINMLAHQLNRLSEHSRYSRDFTLNSLRHAIREIIACFPVYRTYIDNARGVTDQDREVIEAAVTRARRRNPATDVSVFNFVRDVLLLRAPEAASAEDRREQLTFVLRFQQYTGPVMAKGLEDTAFYRYNRLVSLNEVGGEPAHFGVSLDAFHRHNRERLEHWPHSLLTTTTHDTKRSEDVRARINVLSELPQEWRAVLRRWGTLNRKKKRIVDGQPAPDRNDEYLYYQTLIGAWPLTPLEGEAYQGFKQRMQEYMRKATKEAKVHTSWINPDEDYDEAVQHFVAAVLDDALFSDACEPFAQKVAQYGMYNALSQTLLKLTVPGVPDIYQGNELWDFSLVDPDNRRPVDYERRRQLLTALQEQIDAGGQNLVSLAQDLLTSREDGRIKLYVTHRMLSYRRQQPDLFRYGAYLPLVASGAKQDHVCACARRYDQQLLVAVVPRVLTRLIPDPQVSPLGLNLWADTWLPLPPESGAQKYCNLFTGESLALQNWEGKPVFALGEVFAHFPVAVLVSDMEKLPGRVA